MTFRELVDDRYLRAGFNLTAAVAKVHLDTGVSQRAVRNAYHGHKVTGETSRRLAEWAESTHHVTLDRLAMVDAPARGRG